MKLRTPRAYDRNHRSGGFTLVELAIALMVIGLLIGGVLKGQELIENARLTRIVKDLKDFDTAVMIFRNTYNELPGDMRKPGRLPNCNDEPCNIVPSNAGNGRIDSYAKSANFWRHLFHAGMIMIIHEDPDDPDNLLTISPINTLGGNTSIYYARRSGADTDYTNRYFASDLMASSMLPVRKAVRLDQKIDDGKPRTGIMQAQEPTAGNFNHGPVCTDADDPDAYPGNNPNMRCLVGIISDSMN